MNQKFILFSPWLFKSPGKHVQKTRTDFHRGLDLASASGTATGKVRRAASGEVAETLTHEPFAGMLAEIASKMSSPKLRVCR